MDMPRIWYTRWMSVGDTDVSFEYCCRGGSDSELEYADAVRNCRPVEDRHVPEFLFFREDTAVKPSSRDAFTIISSVLVCSPAFRDVLVAHDLGSTRLHEVPIRRDETGTPSDLPPHFLLHVTERKEGCFAPERSTGVEQFKRHDEPVPRPDALWHDVYNEDELAVHAASAEGADLWHDPRLESRLFLSDRLTRAIKAAGLKSKAFKFIAAKVV